jgi:uncharacterized protein YqjF (DUF2071 family)
VPPNSYFYSKIRIKRSALPRTPSSVRRGPYDKSYQAWTPSCGASSRIAPVVGKLKTVNHSLTPSDKQGLRSPAKQECLLAQSEGESQL